ncbi:MAG TPA: hypothetical protein VK845_03270 [Gemmatimonadales bacterium]|nr:hypothetical protein [Gemmatimonadales bacterium]
MKSIADPTALEQLIERLNALESDTPRKCGTLTAGEMLCHLGDATSSVLKRGATEGTDPSPTAAQDSKGRVRARLVVDADDEAKLEFLNDAG